MSKKSLSKKFKLLFILIFVTVFLFLGLFVLSFYYNPIIHLSSVISSDKWINYKEPSFGITIDYPGNWKKPLVVDRDNFRYVYLDSSDGVYFTFIKNLKDEDSSDYLGTGSIASFSKDDRYVSEKKIINNIEYAVFHNKYQWEQGRYADDYFFAKNPHFLILAKAKITDKPDLERQKLSELILRLIGSVKKI